MSLMADPPGADRLSVRLRRDTQGAHQAAAGSGFLDALAAGRLPWEAYADLTAQHWFLYEAIEAATNTMTLRAKGSIGTPSDTAASATPPTSTG